MIGILTQILSGSCGRTKSMATPHARGQQRFEHVAGGCDVVGCSIYKQAVGGLQRCSDFVLLIAWEKLAAGRVEGFQQSR
jgi:hypothetical protein